MRATVQTSSNTALMNLMNNYARLLEVQNQMASGRRVNSPSDDPLAVNAAMRYDTIIAQTTQYNENISVGDSFLGLSDSALNDVDNILINAKSLIVASANSTTTEDMQETNAVELSNLLQELVAIANRQEGSRYIFGGTETTTEPFSIVNGQYVCYNGNDEDINVQVDFGTYMAMNVTGTDVFGSLTSSVETGNLKPLLNISPDTSTTLSSLNGGDGVSLGSVNIDYTSSPARGLEVNLAAADTIEDVADLIEQASVNRANTYDATDPEYNYILKATLNSEGNGLEITQWNRTTNTAVDLSSDPAAKAISIEEVGNNTTARDLGILGRGTTTGESVLVGADLNPAVSGKTLLADLDGYENAALTICNGEQPGVVGIKESNDDYNTLSDWSLTGLTAGVNCSEDGEFYALVTETSTGNYLVELFSGPEMNQNQLIASGEGTSSTIALEPANASGVLGTVSLNGSSVPSGGSLPFDMNAVFDSSFQATIDIPAFVENGEATAYAGYNTSDMVTGWELHGLEKGTNTDASGNLYTRIEDMGGGVYEVRLYKDSAHTTLVASGTLSGATQGTVTLTGAAGYEEVYGQVTVEWPDASIDAVIGSGPHDMTLTATFATVEDLMNAVNASGTYTTATINDKGTGLEITSRLSGAYLTVSQSVTGASHTGDELAQLSQINLSGITSGISSDIYGNLYAEVVDGSGAGTGPYTVNIYSDSARTTRVATGSSTTTTGTVALSAVDDSGLSGSVYLNYAADDNNIEITAKARDVGGDELSQVSQADLTGLIPGVNASYAGDVYVELEDTGLGIEVRLYSDAKHANQIAVGTLAGTSGTVTLTEVNGSGIGTAGNPASLYIDYTADDSDIVIRSDASSVSGQVRQENVFSVMNDAIAAMQDNDIDALSGLLDPMQDALDHVLQARADVGARQQRMELLTSRHTDELTNFSTLKSGEIDLDFADAIVQYQSQTNTYEASLRVLSQIIPMSLVDFI